MTRGAGGVLNVPTIKGELQIGQRYGSKARVALACRNDDTKLCRPLRPCGRLLLPNGRADRPALALFDRVGTLSDLVQRLKHLGSSARIAVAHRIEWAGAFHRRGVAPPAQPIPQTCHGQSKIDLQQARQHPGLFLRHLEFWPSLLAQVPTLVANYSPVDN